MNGRVVALGRAVFPLIVSRWSVTREKGKHLNLPVCTPGEVPGGFDDCLAFFSQERPLASFSPTWAQVHRVVMFSSPRP